MEASSSSGPFLTLSGVATPPHCRPGCTLGGIRTGTRHIHRDMANIRTVGHMGEGASVQTGGIREVGRTAWVHGCTRVLRGHGQAGMAEEWFGPNELRLHCLRVVCLHQAFKSIQGSLVLQATVYSAFLHLQALVSLLGNISTGPGRETLSVWLPLVELCSLPLSPHGRHLSLGFPFPEH